MRKLKQNRKQKARVKQERQAGIDQREANKLIRQAESEARNKKKDAEARKAEVIAEDLKYELSKIKNDLWDCFFPAGAVAEAKDKADAVAEAEQKLQDLVWELNSNRLEYTAARDARFNLLSESKVLPKRIRDKVSTTKKNLRDSLQQYKSYLETSNILLCAPFMLAQFYQTRNRQCVLR